MFFKGNEVFFPPMYVHTGLNPARFLRSDEIMLCEWCGSRQIVTFIGMGPIYLFIHMRV